MQTQVDLDWNRHNSSQLPAKLTLNYTCSNQKYFHSIILRLLRLECMDVNFFLKILTKRSKTNFVWVGATFELCVL